MNQRLYVGNMSYQTTEASLRAAFEGGRPTWGSGVASSPIARRDARRALRSCSNNRCRCPSCDFWSWMVSKSTVARFSETKQERKWVGGGGGGGVRYGGGGGRSGGGGGYGGVAAVVAAATAAAAVVVATAVAIAAATAAAVAVATARPRRLLERKNYCERAPPESQFLGGAPRISCSKVTARVGSPHVLSPHARTLWHHARSRRSRLGSRAWLQRAG